MTFKRRLVFDPMIPLTGILTDVYTHTSVQDILRKVHSIVYNSSKTQTIQMSFNNEIPTLWNTPNIGCYTTMKIITFTAT